MTKKCSKCREIKPLTDFYKDARLSDGRRSDCKVCVRIRTQIPENKLLQRNRSLKYFHQMTLEEFNSKLESQGGKCAICQSVDPGGIQTFHVDHDHTCCPPQRSCSKCRRGLLCSGCNSGIGGLRDDPNLVAAALEYLKTHVKNQV